MEKSKVKLEVLLPLLLGLAIFLTLFLPLLNRPFHFEELRVTQYFHTPPPSNTSVFSQDTIQGSMLSAFWNDYLKLHPPGLIGFYYLWSFISFEEEVPMRLPLLFLAIFSLYQIFKFLSLYVKEEEAALVTLFSTFLTFWYGQGSLITPETFTLYFAVLSLSFFAQSLKEKKVLIPLILVNLLGASVSYLFLILIALQLFALALTKDLMKKKIACALFTCTFLANGVSYYLIPNKDHSNPLIFYLPKGSNQTGLNFLNLLFKGGVE